MLVKTKDIHTRNLKRFHFFLYQKGLHTSLFLIYLFIYYTADTHFSSCTCSFKNKVSTQKFNNNIRDNGHLTRSLH